MSGDSPAAGGSSSLINDADLEPPVQKEQGFSRFIVVDNLPRVPESKHGKLLAVLKKVYNQVATPVQIDMPHGEDGKPSPGFAFIEFATEEDARNAIEQTNGYRLDKAHNFSVSSMELFTQLDAVTEEFVPPELPAFNPRDNEAWWLLDPSRRDQYVLRYADQTEVMWNEHKFGAKPSTVVDRPHWTESYVQWSPQGSYLATLHSPGVKLWSGQKWECVGKFPHPGVKLLAFSPGEKYLVTFSEKLMDKETPKDPQSVVVWDVRKGTKLRSFVGGKWPVFQWSNDEKYFARLGKDIVSVYETETMSLKDKKSLRLPGIASFCWSPTQSIIACAFPEANNSPARVRLIDVPKRVPLRSQNLFRVMEVNMHWQSEGDYLCVKVDRHSKSGKRTGASFMVFRVKDKGVAVESFEIAKDNLIAFAWEPRGHRFAIVHSSTSARTSVSYYSMVNPTTGAKKLTHLGTLEKKMINRLFWSPAGNHIVMAGIGSGFNGVLEFFDTRTMSIIRTAQHNMLTDVLWDPSGQYVSTFVSYWRHQVENGYMLWTFQGKQLFRAAKDKFYQLLWRPRPPAVLSEEKRKEVESNLKSYALRYIEEENKMKEQALEEYLAKKAAKSDRFHKLRLQRVEDLLTDAKEREVADPPVFIEVEEEKEVLLEEKTDVLH